MDVSGTSLNGLLLEAGKAQQALQTSVRKLSSGLRVQTASDDPSGLAIAESLQSQVNGLDAGTAAIQDARNAVNVADGALETITRLLQRARVLATAASSDIVSRGERSDLQAELDQLRAEIDKVAQNTSFNGRALLDGSASSALPQPARVVLIQNDALAQGGTIYDSTYDPAQPSAQQLFDPVIGFEPVAQKVTVTGYDAINDVLLVTITATALATGANLNDPLTGAPPSNTNIATDIPIGNNNFGQPGPPGSGVPPTPGSPATFYQTDYQANYTGSPLPVLGFNLGNLTAGDVGAVGILITLPPQTKAAGSAIEVATGSNEGATVSIDIRAVNAYNLGLGNVNLGTSVDQSQVVETYIDNALNLVTAQRAQLGAQAVSLTEAATNNQVAAVNTQASESAVRDVSIATEIASFTQAQILTLVQTDVLRSSNNRDRALLQLVADTAL